MDFGTAEIEITTYLAGKIIDPNVTVVPIPEVETEIKPGFGKKNVIVAFASEEADPDENLGPVVQNTGITFSILLQGKLLRGSDGLYKLAEDIKKFLTGFKPTDLRELTYVNHRFVANEDKVFKYVLDFKTQGVRVQDITEDTTGPAFKDVQYIDPE